MKRLPLAAQLLKWLLITVFGLATILGAYWLWLIWCYDKPFHRIVRGDTEDRVVALLGKPCQVPAPHDVLKETWANEESFGIPNYASPIRANNKSGYDIGEKNCSDLIYLVRSL